MTQPRFTLPSRPAHLPTVALVGPAGVGKSDTLLSLLKTLRDRRREVRIDEISFDSDQQYARVVLHGATERTAANAAEHLVIRPAAGPIRIEAWAGENNRVGNVIDLPGLLRYVAARRIDLLGLVVNPFQHDPTLGAYAFLELTWWWQTHTSFDLGRCAELAASLLWGVTPEGLAKLRGGWAKLAPSALRDARLVRDSVARLGIDLRQAFHVEGVPPAQAQQIVTVMERTAATIVAGDDAEWRVVVELARRFPDSLVVVTRADLLAYLPGLHVGDLREFGRRLFVAPEMVRLSQVVVQGSLELVLRDDADEPVWVQGPSSSADELLEAIQRQLPVVTGRTPPGAAEARPQFDAVLLGLTLGLLVVLLALLFRHPVDTLVACGVVGLLALLAFGAWRLTRAWARNRAEREPLPEARPAPGIAREVAVEHAVPASPALNGLAQAAGR